MRCREHAPCLGNYNNASINLLCCLSFCRLSRLYINSLTNIFFRYYVKLIVLSRTDISIVALLKLFSLKIPKSAHRRINTQQSQRIPQRSTSQSISLAYTSRLIQFDPRRIIRILAYQEECLRWRKISSFLTVTRRLFNRRGFTLVCH